MAQRSNATRTILVDDLQAAMKEGLGKKTAVKTIISLAKAGHYDDFDTTLSMPKHALVEDLNNAGLARLAWKAVNGDYD